MAIPSSREGWQQKTRPMARLPSLKSESCNPDASRCSRWVVSLRMSSRVAVVITCASRNAPTWSLLGGYNFEVPALETAQPRRHVIMSNTAGRSLRNRQRDAREFDWSNNHFNDRCRIMDTPLAASGPRTSSRILRFQLYLCAKPTPAVLTSQARIAQAVGWESRLV